jgi:electron transfer flavoprotein alpha subunit
MAGKNAAGCSFLVFLEQRDGKVKQSSIEVWSGVQELARSFRGWSVAGILAGPADTAGLASSADGPVKLFHASSDSLALYMPEIYADLVSGIVLKERADAVFMANTAMGRDLAPRVALRLDAAVLPDCAALTVRDGELISHRFLYSGTVLALQRSLTEKTIHTLCPHVFSRSGRVSGHLHVEEPAFSLLPDSRLNPAVTGMVMQVNRQDVSEADIIVAGGRGMGGAEHFFLLEQLAEVLGGSVGASRTAVDDGWRPHADQIGQTGKSVSPRLYISCGISGAIQHLAGIAGAKTVVAVNSDPHAPIFQAADYGIVGDVHDVLPKLTEAVKEFLKTK